ncbi:MULTISPECIES: MFS transporter [unclassified Rhizobium]|jgi:MFS family permease|uniref:MFS transporter n=1 Tax=unclassified Rhizobium TaxID=2613769 RepID=UPI0006479C46|nr:MULTISPECIES: MFS transporter [unclassified Rhizobium]MBN8951400.1 MFS transporter [Rhizobium tropici]OJY74783.1 MAG: MFS transporter [Rhizobium sp. 60-20]RKD66703.1 putative MFS family arabinose efflux permease [Rhizobium sp. WW_1]
MDTLQNLDQPGVLGHPGYRSFVASRVFSSIGFQSVTVAMGWMIYDQTHSAFFLGLVGFCQFLPMVILTFVVGHVADRFDRRRIGLACQLIEALTAVALAVAVWHHWIGPAGILGAVAVMGSATAFERPTMAALLPNIVPVSMLQIAIATSTSMMQTAFIIGPSLGGLLYGVNPVAPFAVSAMLYIIASVNVISIRLERQQSSSREPVTMSSVFAGVSFIKSRPVMLGTISLDLFAVLLGGATALLPMFARDILHAGPWGLGLLRASPAIGALVMSIWLARRPLQTDVGKKMLFAVLVFGVATIVFSLSSNIILSVAALFVVGASDTVSVVVRSSLVQLLTPDAMRGRVNAVNSLFIGTSNQLGEFESGMLASALGPVLTGIVGGVGTIVVVLLWTRLFPDLTRVKTLRG